MRGKDEIGIEIKLLRTALKNEQEIASTTVVTHLHIKLHPECAGSASCHREMDRLAYMYNN